MNKAIENKIVKVRLVLELLNDFTKNNPESNHATRARLRSILMGLSISELKLLSKGRAL